MTGHLDELYFNWLYSQVASPRVRSKTRRYWSLLEIMHRREFIWLIPNDDNRAQDGKDLRREFLQSTGVPVSSVDEDWLALGCSVLEMMVVVARMAAFESDGRADDWFWIICQNLNIHNYSDAVMSDREAVIVEDILDDLVWRRYRPDGRGGMFPLNNPDKDQTRVEIWYQLCSYILEVSDI